MADTPRKVDVLYVGQHHRSTYLNALKADMESWLEECHYTPDASAIQRFDEVDVFIVGPMKKGFRSHHHLKNGKPLGVGYTVSDRFRMWKTDAQLAPYPVVLAQGTPHMNGSIYGEVWRIPVADLFKLDYYESNSTMFRRQKVPIDMMVGANKVNTFAWMYIGMRSYWDARIGKKIKGGISLVECDLLTPNIAPNKRYYNYMKKYEPKDSQAVG